MKKRWLSVFMIICLLLSACGTGATVGKETETDEKTQSIQETGNADAVESREEEQTKEWIADKIKLPDADAALGDMILEESAADNEMWGIAEETIYRFLTISSSPEDSEHTLCYVQTLQAPYTEWVNHSIALEEWVTEESVSLSYAMTRCLSEDGTIYVLLRGSDHDYIGKWSIAEGFSATRMEGEWIPERGSGRTINKLHMGEGLENYVLYMDFDAVSGEIELSSTYLDEEYKKLAQVPDIKEGYVWQPIVNPFSGETYLCGSDENGVILSEGNISMGSSGFSIWAEDGELVFFSEDTGMSYLDKVVFCSDTEGYLCNTKGLWQFSLDDQSMELLFDRYENQYYLDMFILQGFCMSTEGKLLFLFQDAEQEYVLWEMAEDTESQEEQAEKKELELAITFESSFLKQAIVDFNKQSEEYRIVLRTAGDGEDYEDFRTRIQAELAAGKGPDLLAAQTAIDVEAGAQRGYLLNLSDYFAEYEDAVLPSVWQTGQVEGKLYAVPYSCGINTLVASADVVGERTSWTLQEAMKCMEESGAASFAGMENEAGLFYKLGLKSEGNAGLVDWEQGKSYLNSDEAVQLLEFSTKYADKESTYSNVEQRIADGEVLTYVLNLYGYNPIQIAMAVFQNKEVYIGFPTEDGGSGSLIYGNSFAVNQACADVDGAVEFLKYLLSEEVQGRMAEEASKDHCGFPVQREALEQFFDYLREEDEKPEGLSYVGEFLYQQTALTEENIDRLREMFLTARPEGTKSEKLMSVIEEEMNHYISGDRTAKEVLDVVQNRAQLYLDEIQ